MSVKNFVQCGLVTPVAANTVELVLAAPTASYQYPPLDGGTLVIADSVTRPSFYEIISYTHRINNVLYGVVRAKEGTTARAWTGSVWVYQALTAQDYVDALALKAALASPAFTGIPTAPTAALGTNTNQIATMAALKQAIDALVGGAPGVLDALNEFAAALGNDPNFATTMTNALAGKEPSIAAGTSAQMWLGNKTWASVLSQVQNTLLTGLGVGSNATIVSTDTLIAALAKIQNQLNNKVESTDTRLTNAREWTATDVTQAEAEAGSVTVARKWSPLRVWQAVLGSKLTGINLTLGTAVSATDTVLIALGKLQKQITDAATNLAGNVRATVLTGYVTGSNAVLDSTDTVLAAFGKVQAQITGLVTSKLDATANAVSATKLQTARTIGGVAFDGTANINLPGVNAAGNQSTTGSAATLTTGRTITMTGDVSWTSPAFNGSSNVTAVATLANTGVVAGTYPKVAVDAKGRVTAGASMVEADVPALSIAKTTGLQSALDSKLDSTANAVSATKLATARTINGVAFDGTTNITIADATKLPLTGGTLSGDLTVGATNRTANTTVRVLAGDAYNAGFEAYGTSQGTGYLFVGQEASHGGGIFYNGDGTPAFATGETADIVAFYRVSAGAKEVVFSYPHNSNNVTFRGTISGNGSGLTTLNASNMASGTVPDARLSGTYTGVNITGNAATATKLQTARTINGVAFDGTADITVADSTKVPLTSTTGAAVIPAGTEAQRPASPVNGQLRYNSDTKRFEGRAGDEWIALPSSYWESLPIGVPIPVWDHIAGVAVPPTNDSAFRYVKLTASDAYNSGVLTSETVAGSAPLVQATAVISDSASPINGQTIRLINTERRFLRAGSSGEVEADAMQGHRHATAAALWTTSPTVFLGSGGGFTGASNNSAILNPTTDGVNGTPRTANETRSKNIGATYYMRIR